MDILEKLKKSKKSASVFDSLIDKKDAKEEAASKPDDIEVKEISPAQPIIEPAKIEAEPIKEKLVREFRTEGMHEFDIDSLATSNDALIKAEYKSKLNKMIDDNKIDEAIDLLKELKEKLTEQK